MNTSDEQLCQRCGRCCYAKLIIDDDLYYTPVPCPHLDTQTNLCKVYERRFELEPDCLPVEEGIARGVFPADCPYVDGLADYKPPHTDGDLAEMARLYRETD